MAHLSAVRIGLASVGRLFAALLLASTAIPGTAIVSLMGLAAFDAAAYTSNATGSSVITGRTNKNGGTGCGGCHGQDATMSVEITGPTSAPHALSGGQSGTFTITATKSGTSGYLMGIAVAATDATSLSNFAGEPTAITNGEVINHSGAGALRTSNGTTANYKFTFTMPAAATPGSSKTIFGLAAMGVPRAPWNHASNVTVYVRPSAPSNVATSNVTAASVDLSWSGGGTNYLVVHKTGASAPSSPTDGTAFDAGASTSTTVSGLTPSTQYSFAVFSKITGVAVYSTTAATTSATTSTPVVAPRYVNAASGVNTGNCTSAGAPCKTITYAMSQATTGSPGDSVNVAPGTYNVALGETFPITVKSGVQLQATGTAANTIVDATGANERVFNASGSNASTVVQGFTITGGLHLPATNSNAQGGAMLIDNLAQIKVRRNIFVDNEARGYNGVAPSSPSGGVAYGGAIVSSNASPTIENNVFNSNTVRGGNGVSKFDGSVPGGAGQGHGGALFVGGGAAVIVNNTFYANEAFGGSGGSTNGANTGGAGGLAFNGAVESNNASVVNNIFVNNTAAGGSGGGGSPPGSTGNSFNGALNDNGGPSTTKNLFFGNTAASNGDTQGTTPVLLNPQFQAAPTNLRIGPTSPAKAAGTAVGAPAMDLDGTPRPSPPSIGAFEASDPTVVYNLVLEGWQQVSPYVVTNATGTGTATYNTATRALTLNLPYSGLGSAEVGAHIHGPGARGANAGVIFALAAGSPKADTVTLSVAQEAQLVAGQLYVNIHTANFAAGELRAQIDNVGTTVTRVLTVAKAGTGTGTVTGTAEPGTVIACGSDCTETVPNGKVVTLTAASSTGSTFAGWSGGGCSGTGNCVVTMNAAATVTATFTTDPSIVYNMVLEGWQQVSPYVVTGAAGTGTATYNTVTRALTLNLPYAGLGSAEVGAHVHGPGARGANAGVIFALAAGSPKADTVTLSVAQEAQLVAGELYVNIHTSNFPNGEIRAQIDNVGTTVTRVLSVAKTGTGTGTVTGTAEPGTVIACGSDCTETVPNGKAVTLTASGSAGSAFTGWSGGGCSGTGNCVVTMNAAATVTATFTTITAGPAVGLSATSIAFGGQSMGTTSPASTLTLTNTGTATLTVSSVTIDNAQFTRTHNCTSVAAAATCAINVSFSPANVAGALNSTAAVTGTLSIASDASGTPHAVGLSGTGERSLITQYYRAILNRLPDASGKAFWEAEAARLTALGANVNEVWFVMANYFFNSPEYIASGKTNTAFMIDVYNTFFNRPPDQGGFDFWMSQMNAGLSREGVIFWFMFSNEFRTFTQGIFGSTAARPEVDMVMDFFRGILNRFPDTAAFNAFVGGLRSAQCQAPAQRPGAVYTAVNDMSYFFIFGSAEYGNRARNNTQNVSDMYNSFLRRGGTADEVGFWINQLNTAAKDRNRLRVDFIASPEFGARVNAVINAGCVQ